MTITITHELESALKEAAERRGTDAETLALETLRSNFVKPKKPDIPHEEWIAGLRAMAIDCGVSLSDEDLSRERMYDL
ncbi:MAG: hypothetical protein K2W96_00125 [Gemmataceae bacterium]|nr:hypothetical protein [Gemmataceae bacterium]